MARVKSVRCHLPPVRITATVRAQREVTMRKTQSAMMCVVCSIKLDTLQYYSKSRSI